jgi:two-component system sensor histidine kinase PilS (NtrC family)
VSDARGLSAAALPASRHAHAQDSSAIPDSFWVSLRYFNFYRTIVAAVFFVSVLVYRDALNFGNHNLRLFTAVAGLYLLAAVVFHVMLRRFPHRFNTQLTVHVLTDILALTTLLHASGGFKSGLAVMLLISLAGAALVSRGSLMLFYAAAATIAVLIEQGYWVLTEDQSVASFLQPGLISIGFFATALITNQLAQRVIMNERVARRRGIDLANQLRINQLVIQDAQDGVLVVDENGLVRQYNRQVEALTGQVAPELEQIESYSPDLATALAAWRAGTGPSSATFALPKPSKVARARFVEAGVEGASFTVIYLEDVSKLEDQARQLKLAALGRLTANIAHEIRNPLAAITHAAELMQEENRGPARDRLCRIMRDNAHRLDRIVRDVMELNRRDRVQQEPIRLAGFLEVFVDEFAQNEQVPREGFVVEADGDPVVDFDRVHLNQVVWNLARNAWRHSKKQPGSVRLRLLRQSNRLELRVIDDGAGVPQALQGQLFEPFFTTYSGGTGLGLYIARELCSANGAALDYVGRDAGADFRIVWQGMRA